MMDLTPAEKNEIKKRLYSMFPQVEKEVIDMVLSNCNYNEDEAYEHIIVMAGDNLSTERWENTAVQTEQARSPNNLFEQLSSSPNVRSGLTPCNTAILSEQTDTEYLFPVSTFSSVDSTFSLNDFSVLQRDCLYTDFCTPPSKLISSKLDAYREMKAFQDSEEMGEINTATRNDSLKVLLNSDDRFHLVILRGLPGSGKSTLARLLCGLSGEILSTDDFFIINGHYKLDKSRLSEAHEWNQRRASYALQRGCSPIFIDNTNTRSWEMKPYVSMGLKYNYEMMILEPDNDWAWKPKILALKNSHGVPRDIIEMMNERYEKNITIEYMINLITPKNMTPSAFKTQHRKQSFSRLEETQKHSDLTDNFDKGTLNYKNGQISVENTLSNHNNRFDVRHQQETHGASYIENETRNGISELFSNSAEINEHSAFFNPSSNANSLVTSSLNMLTVPELPSIPTTVSGELISKPVFTEPPRVFRVVDLENENNFSDYIGSSSSKHHDTKGPSSSRIGDIVNNYKNWSDDNLDKSSNTLEQVSEISPNIIDLTNADESDIEDLAAKSGNMNLNSLDVADEQFTLHCLEFLYECFPDFSRPYCKRWLKKYNGDIVKTCDYLSRLSQLADDDDFPIDNSSSGNSSEFVPSELPDDSQAEKQLDVALSNVLEPREPDGELFYEEGHDLDGIGNMNIAMNRKFGKELIRRFGKEGDIDDNKLTFDDYMFNIDNIVGEKLYTCWVTSVKAKKRKLESILHDDELYVQRLQDEENKSQLVTESPDGPANKTKRRKMKPLPISTELSKSSTAQLHGGLFSPSSPWKSNQDQETEIKDATGSVLTLKQLNIRTELHQQFPGVEEDDLDQVLTATSYNLQHAIALVNDSCNLPKSNNNRNNKNNNNNNNNNNKDTQPDGADWIFVESPSKNRTQKELSPSRIKKRADASSSGQQAAVSPSLGSQNYQAVVEEQQGYIDFRAEAHMHANLRAECFQKAAKAFQEKKGQVAQYYADQAHQHTLKMKEAHQRAAELTIWRCNKGFMKDQRVIDLHGLHADEAVRALKNFLKNAVNVGHRQVEVITGRGKNSKNGYSTVKNAVQSVLAQRRYKFSWAHHGGSVMVNL